MILRRVSLFSSVVFVASLAAACGGDDNASGGSSVDGNKNLLELTDQDSVALCKFYERTYKGSLGSEEQYCTANALFGASSVEDCEEYRDQCIEDGEFDDDAKEDWHCEDSLAGDFVEEDGECEATVAELEACIKEQADASKDLTKYTCEEVEDVEVEIQGPACTKLAEKCPGVEL